MHLRLPAHAHLLLTMQNTIEKDNCVQHCYHTLMSLPGPLPQYERTLVAECQKTGRVLKHGACEERGAREYLRQKTTSSQALSAPSTP